MGKGTVVRIIRNRGFGFLKQEDGTEVFFHRTSLQGVDFDTLTEGLTLEFDIEQGDKGPRAANVRKAD